MESKTTYRYYKDKGLGVVGVRLDSIGHQDGEYTWLANRRLEYRWIKTKYLYDTRKEAEISEVAEFS